MDPIANVGLTVTSNSGSTTTTATFDNVVLTPAATGVAVVTEDMGTGAPGTSTFSQAAGTYTIAGSGSIFSNGAFYGSQYSGDFTVTAKHVSATSNAGSAASGIMIRESMDSNAAFVHLGRLPTTAFGGFFWRAITSGSTDSVPSFGGAVRWMRLVRQGNTVTGYHAPDNAGAPGTWAQLGQPQTIIMPTSVLVGFAVDNASGVGLNTVAFSNFTLTPLNNAPLVSIANVPNGTLPPIALNGTVTDDNFPTPVALTTLWSAASAPGSVTFTNPAAIDTSAAFGASGNYRLRLAADDGSIQSFRDVTFTSAPGNSPPFIATQPTSLSVALGQPAVFTAVAYGGTVNYQWRKGTTNIPGATNATYTIPATALGDAATDYNVVASNAIGSTPSNLVALEVVSTPVITIEPASIQINVGQSTTLSVTATGLNLLYQWRKYGIDIPGATARTYPITNALASDTGDYTCLVSNIAGSDLSAVAFLGVAGIPSISTHPAGSTIAEGSGFSFSVVAAGLNLSYQWQKGTTAIPSATSATYAPGTSTASSAGSYSCIVSNTAGSVTSNPATLTVISLAVITKQPASATVVNGSTVMFSMTASGVGLTYKWQKDNVDIVPPATSTSLFVNNVQTANIGAYRCVVTNLAGPQPTNAANLVVVYAPVINTQPVAQLIADGAPASFSIGITGLGLSYKWQKNGIDISGATSSTYNIPTATGTHVGSYRCLVSNIAGSAASTPADLNIIGAPAITSQPQNLYAEAGANGALTVVANIGSPTYQWQKNGVAIPTATSPTYLLPNLQTASTGNYTCVVTNAVTSVTTRTAVVSLVTDLGKGVEDSTHKWQSIGPVPWVYQTGTTHDLVDSNLSRSLKDNESATLKVTVTGPATVRFWWKTSTQVGDALSFAVDGVTPPEVTSISGEYDWAQIAYVIPTGSHDLTWTFAKDSSGSAGADYAWLDELRLDPPFTIITQPESQLAHLGSAVTFSVVTSGLPTTYQWKRNGSSIAGATASSYVLPNATTALAGDYTCLVGGVTTSSIAKLWVVGDPAPARVANNTTATLPLSVGGTGLTFQWFNPSAAAMANTTHITGATASTLTVKNSTLADEGDYFCQVTAPGLSSPLVIAPCTLDIVSIPVITTPATDPGIVSGFFSWQMTATDYPTSYTITGLPKGLTYSTTTGLISGTPDVFGSFTLYISAKNAAGSVLKIPLSFSIQDLPPGTTGNWSGIVARDTTLSELGGYLTVAISGTGGVTGKLLHDSKSYPLKGRLSATVGAHPTAHLSLTRTTGLAPLLLDLDFNTAAETLSGNLTVAASSPAIAGARHVWKTGRTASSYAGNYNCGHDIPIGLLFNSAIPQGAGYSQLKITDLGVVTTSGKLSDGSTFTHSATLWPDGSLPTFAVLHSGKGSLLGTHNIALGTAVDFSDNLVTSTLTWRKTAAASASDLLYPAGFASINLVTDGGKYIKPIGVPVLGLTDAADNAKIDFTEGGIATAAQLASLNQTFWINSTSVSKFDTATTGNPCLVALTITPATGLFTGSFKLLDAGVSRTASLSGIILSHRNRGRGAFQLPTLPNPTKSQKLSGLIDLHSSL